MYAVSLFLRRFESDVCSYLGEWHLVDEGGSGRGEVLHLLELPTLVLRQLHQRTCGRTHAEKNRGEKREEARRRCTEEEWKRGEENRESNCPR
jgi:hypothetical protein